MTTKRKRELPTDIKMILLIKISFLAKDIHVKTREASKNPDLDLQEFSGIDKILQTKQVILQIIPQN